MSAQKSKQGLNATQIILIVGIAVVIIAVAVVGYFMLSKQKAAGPAVEPKAAGQGVVITEENVNSVREEPGTFTTNMNAIWNFNNGNAPSNDAKVGNDSSNTRKFYFEVSLADTQELVYTSPIIPVGSELKEMILDKPLKKGTYDALCSYNLLKEDGSIYSTISFGVVINIIN